MNMFLLQTPPSKVNTEQGTFTHTHTHKHTHTHTHTHTHIHTHTHTHTQHTNILAHTMRIEMIQLHLAFLEERERFNSSWAF
jgi:hypothetical protein